MTTPILERFLRYVKIHTTSQEGIDTIPSTIRQFDLAKILVRELKESGVSDAIVDDHCYVIGSIPSNLPEEQSKKIPIVCFLAHMDTSPEEPGENVNPQIIKNYDGGNILLPNNSEIFISPIETPALKRFIGSDIITADGITLLGGDNKAGIAAIMTAVETIYKNPEIKHGVIKIVFTPDEEIGHGVDALDLEALGAEVGYTIDGDEMGVLEYETFNAAGGTIMIKGFNFHPGYAKDKLVNSIRIMGDIINQFPLDQAPETTEGREGYFHVYEAEGSVNESKIRFILRDFDYAELKNKISWIESKVADIQEKYPKAKIHLSIKEQYKNMRYQLEKVPYTIQYAEEAIKRSGIDVIKKPVRGGTDGARLSYKGLPTPNIFSGAMNFHSKKEFVPLIALEKSVETILNLIQIFYERSM